ncbi:MAG TPA: PEP-CTERM sorting domain-containing protein [Bryobacteraceae bacterium]|jgi:hypothetical protein|nr:PEP-CTERM sorting domain-containing protein [Bryobacteraceae bacterium]
MMKSVCVGALSMALAGVSLHAGTVVLGEPAVPGTGNCDPFGCPAFFGLGTYQQVYLASAFPGVINIDDLAFFQGQILQNGGQPAGGTYTFSLSYTSDAPGGLDLTNPNNNVTSGSATFFSGTLPALAPDSGPNVLSFSGSPFAYNPADGNLLLTISITGATNSLPFLYLDEAQCGPATPCPIGSTVVSSNAYFGSVKGVPVSGGNDVGGLITAFSYTASIVPTPEPGSVFLVLAGIGMIGYHGRRGSARRAKRASGQD